MLFDFDKDYVLENEMVRLEPLNAAHLSHLSDVAKSPEIWVFFDEGGPGIEEFQTYHDRAIRNRANHVQYPFVVFDKRARCYAGMTRLYAYDSKLKNIKLGHTWYGKKFQKTGLNKACKHCILKFVFESLDVERVGLGVHEENVQSKRALASIGIRKEGELLNFFYKIESEGRCALILYGVTKQEWKSKLKNKLHGQYKSYLA
ncbi:MAG: GNAT family protein [Bacteroidota bacterium]